MLTNADQIEPHSTADRAWMFRIVLLILLGLAAISVCMVLTADAFQLLDNSYITNFNVVAYANLLPYLVSVTAYTGRLP